MADPTRDDHKLWRLGYGILILTVLAELFYEPHPYFTIDGLFGFHATFGFIACLMMVAVAKPMAVFLKRPDIYYDGEE